MRRDASSWVAVGVLLSVFLFVLSFRVFAENRNSWYFDTSGMYTYEEMETDIRELKRLAPKDFLEVERLSSTYDGRKIYHIMEAGATRNILIIGAIHGREYLTAQLVMKQLEDLVQRHQTDRSYKDVPVRTLLKNVRVHFVPMSNPDSVAISQFGLDGMKNAVPESPFSGALRMTAVEIFRLI